MSIFTEFDDGKKVCSSCRATQPERYPETAQDIQQRVESDWSFARGCQLGAAKVGFSDGWNRSERQTHAAYPVTYRVSYGAGQGSHPTRSEIRNAVVTPTTLSTGLRIGALLLFGVRI